ncbi:MAG: hypothetical protein V7688_09700 [Alcanivorax jadensis]|uniref:hypothetical protein n=1 Tax=Alcanivorax jadensis TaxID=64988 RepID=UPI00300117C8
MSIKDSFSLKSVSIKDLVVNLKDKFRPSLVDPSSEKNFAARIKFSLSDTFEVMCDSEDEKNYIDSCQEMPERLPEGCIVFMNALYELSFFEALPDDMSEEPTGSYACAFEVSIQALNAVDDMGGFPDFVQSLALTSSWPYFRDHAQTTFMKMGFRCPPPIPISPKAQG